MLDLTSEKIVSLNDATDLLPRRRRGRKPHVATLYRWAQRGCKGVVLETAQVGGTKCTSVEALQRFIDTLSRASGCHTPAGTVQPSSRRAHERAERELDRGAW